jgi:hypothetical protein
MATSGDTHGPADRGADGRGRSDRPPEVLDSKLVSYSDRPDRRTVYPRGLSRVALMSTWMTANDSAFVDVEANR